MGTQPVRLLRALLNASDSAARFEMEVAGSAQESSRMGISASSTFVPYYRTVTRQKDTYTHNIRPLHSPSSGDN